MSYSIRQFLLPIFTVFLLSSGPLSCYNTVHFTDATHQEPAARSAIVTTLYGTFTVTEPVLLDLLDCDMMHRLKQVRQYGPFYFAIKPVGFTRYDHSIGVFGLLRRIGASLAEQVAGLIHDISHPAFSHGSGYAFRSTAQEADAHQDDCHADFLSNTGIETILLRHGFTIDSIHNKNPEFTALERSLPYLCADRIEYNIHGGLAEELITQAQAAEIIDSLIFEDGVWLFTNPTHAERFARISLWKTEHTWGSAASNLINVWMGQALRRAFALNILQEEDILYGTDDAVWNILRASTDSTIADYMNKIEECTVSFTLDPHEYDYILHTKFRGIDPMIKTDQGIKLLSEISDEFKHDFLNMKAKIAQGWPIKFKR